MTISTPNPRDYATFAAWLAAVTARRGAQREIARACEVTPQAITRWLGGSQVRPERLKRLAAWSGWPYSDLRMLVDGLAAPPPPPSAGPVPTTDELLERWRTLPPAARVYVISLMDALSRIPADSLPQFPPTPPK